MLDGCYPADGDWFDMNMAGTGEILSASAIIVLSPLFFVFEESERRPAGEERVISPVMAFILTVNCSFHTLT